MNTILKKAGSIALSAVLLSSMAAALPSDLTVFADETYYTRDPFYNFSSNVNTYESDHFQFIWGNSNESSKVTQEFLQENAKNLEDCWKVYMDDLDMYPPSHSTAANYDNSKNYKLNIYISNTGLQPSTINGWTFEMSDDWAYMAYDPDGYPYLFVCPGAMEYDPPSWVLPHEFGHAVTAAQLGWNTNKYSYAWWEAIANWYREQYLSSNYYNYDIGHRTDFFETYMKNLCLTFPCGRDFYAAWPFLQYLNENPDKLSGYGNNFVTKMLKEGKVDEYPLTMVNRLADADIKDTLGHFAKRMATLDLANQENYRARLDELFYNDWNWREIYTLLEKSDDSGWYYVPTERAPQQAGLNIVPLSLSGNTVSASLEGLTKTAGADWRACLVIEDTSGKTHYSPLFKSGETGSLTVADPKSAYLTVIATPDEETYVKSALPQGDASEFSEGNMPFRSKTTYPYRVKLEGADIYCQTIDTSGISGHAHSNGGGFVANTATVADSVYVGKDAMVLGYANVSGNAVIKDHAVVEGNAKISGNAVIADYAMVCESPTIKDDAYVGDTAQVMGNATVSGNAKVIESAVVFANYSLSGNAIAKGLTYSLAAGSLSGQGMSDGDYYDDASKTVTKGTAYGWVSSQSYVDKLSYTDGLYVSYDFDEDSSAVVKDRYTTTYGYSINSPEWAASKTGAEGVLSYNGSQYTVLDNSLSYHSDIQIQTAFMNLGGDYDQKLFFSGNKDSYMYLSPYGKDGKVEFVITDGNTTTTLSGKGGELGEWCKVDVLIAKGTATLKINGTAVDSAATSLTPYSVITDDSVTYLGRGYEGDNFKGRVDNFRVFFKEVPSDATLYSEKEDVTVEQTTTTVTTTTTTTTSTTTTSYEELPPVPLYGDVNADGLTNIADAVVLTKFLIKLPAENCIYPDVNADGKANVIDLAQLKIELHRIETSG